MIPQQRGDEYQNTRHRQYRQNSFEQPFDTDLPQSDGRAECGCDDNQSRETDTQREQRILRIPWEVGDKRRAQADKKIGDQDPYDQKTRESDGSSQWDTNN